MNQRFRIALVLLALALSVYQAIAVFTPIAIPKPSQSVLWWAVSLSASCAGWLVLFMPAWLPAAMPSRYARLRLLLFAVCGAVLVGFGCLLVLYGALLAFPNHFLFYGLLALPLGCYYLRALMHAARAAPLQNAA